MKRRAREMSLTSSDSRREHGRPSPRFPLQERVGAFLLSIGGTQGTWLSLAGSWRIRWYATDVRSVFGDTGASGLPLKGWTKWRGKITWLEISHRLRTTLETRRPLRAPSRMSREVEHTKTRCTLSGATFVAFQGRLAGMPHDLGNVALRDCLLTSLRNGTGFSIADCMDKCDKRLHPKPQGPPSRACSLSGQGLRS